VKVRVERVVVKGSTHAPEAADLRSRIGDELHAAVQTDRVTFRRNPAAAVASAVARALGGSA
jgi:hypothetical protein